MGHDERVSAVAALADPLRRALYEHVARAGADVSRDGAAEAVGVSRSVAAFHLDRLVEEGLLEASFRRLSGRRGPGAGRPSKLYRRATCEIAVSLPARQYDLAAGLLAAAIGETGTDIGPALARVAHQRGVELAAKAEGGPPAPEDVLASAGYEPRRAGQDDDGLLLANCPFHQLVDRHPELVCGMNLAFVQGVLEGSRSTAYQAVADPQPGRCCVRVVARRKEQ
ncbi:MAG: helix-turn-helix transcriptional regulator [Acidimicrobiales bacterium]